MRLPAQSLQAKKLLLYNGEIIMTAGADYDLSMSNILVNDSAIPFLIATYIFWNRDIGSFGSFVSTAERRPISSISSTACASQDPAVLMETW